MCAMIKRRRIFHLKSLIAQEQCAISIRKHKIVLMLFTISFLFLKSRTLRMNSDMRLVCSMTFVAIKNVKTQILESIQEKILKEINAY